MHRIVARGFQLTLQPLKPVAQDTHHVDPATWWVKHHLDVEVLDLECQQAGMQPACRLSLSSLRNAVAVAPLILKCIFLPFVDEEF